MALIQATMEGVYALSLAVIVAVIYLGLVRFADLNEKEPVWAIGMMLILGAMGAVILPLLVGSVVLEISTLWGAVAKESAKFVAFALGAVALAAVGRLRGWSEINDLMDGIVYGTAVGFGFAIGEAFIRELTFGGAFGEAIDAGPFATLWTTVLVGLSDGLFGGIIGAGFGAAVGARSVLQRVGYLVAGLVGAVVLHALYTTLAQGNALGGSGAVVRTWIALLIPLLFVIALMVVSLSRERRTIQQELDNEKESGIVTDEEFAALRSFVVRRSRYIAALTRGDFDGWLAMRELHNRQVQLALAKSRLAGAPDSERQTASEAEVERLRAAVLEIKHREEIAQKSPRSGEAGA